MRIEEFLKENDNTYCRPHVEGNGQLTFYLYPIIMDVILNESQEHIDVVYAILSLRVSHS